MILAAGYGKRFEPLTSVVPKPLIPFFNKPIIDYTLDFLKANNIREVVINTHHLGSNIQDYLGDGKSYDMRFYYSGETEILGTAGGIKAVESLLDNETFLVINGDILFNDFILDKMLSFHKKSGGSATFLLREDEEAARFGMIKINNKGQVYSFLNHSIDESQNSQKKKKKTMFTGISLLEPTIFDSIPSKIYCDISTGVYPSLLLEKQLYGYIMNSYWQDVGHHQSYLAAHWDAMEGKGIILGNSFVSPARILSGSKISLTDNSRYAVIGKGCQLVNTSLSHTVVWDGVSLKDCIISDSIIGPNVSIEGKKVQGMAVAMREGCLLQQPIG